MLKRTRIFAALALLIVFAGGIAVGVTGLSGSLAQDASNDAEVRIAARKLDDGRVEFGLQQRTGSEWSERVLPDIRRLPANARVDRWLVSSPVTLKGYATLPIQSAEQYRIDNEGLKAVTFSARFRKHNGLFSTSVHATGSVNYSNIADPHLTFVCFAQADGSGRFEGSVYVPWREHAESVILFVARRYELDRWGFVMRDTIAEELTWDYEEPPGWFNTAWAVSQDEMRSLKGFHELRVAYQDLNLNVIVAAFDLQQALGTPVQANLDHCGEYEHPEYGYEVVTQAYDGH